MPRCRVDFQTFTREELRDIAKAWAAISFAFAVLLLGGTRLFTASPGELLRAMGTAAVTVGIGFVLHELGHKFVAQRYGCVARFRSFDTMLLIAVFSSFLGFLFAAPGAVFISGAVTYQKSGRIAAAGPLVNIALALLFSALAVFLPAASLLAYGASVNIFLAFFNMLPFGSFDGLKVLLWDKRAFAALFLGSLALMVVL